MSRSCAVRRSSSDFASSRVRGFDAFEQPHVLDGDDRLVGERRHQVDLALGKRVNPAPCQPDDADRLAFAHERHADHRANPSDLGVLLLLVEWIGPCVVDPNDSAVHGGTADDRSRPRHNRRLSLDFQISRRNKAGRRPRTDKLRPPVCRSRLLGAAEPRRGVHDTLQDGLQLELGSADDAKYLRRRGLLLQRFGEFAVRCCSASNSRAFSMAMTAWSAKVAPARSACR